jgi:hypothetical protein
MISQLPFFTYFQFAIAWWLWIDAHAFSSKFEENGVYVTFPIYLPGIFSTVAMIMYAYVFVFVVLGSFQHNFAISVTLFI